MFAFERNRVNATDMQPGPLPARLHLLATGILFAVLLVIAFPLLSVLPVMPLVILIALALLLARTMAIDLCHFLLLDIYTLAILALGLASPFLMGASALWYYAPIGAAVGLGVGLLLAFITAKLKGDTVTEHIGGGDIKMLAAIGAWTGPTELFTAIVLIAFFGFGVAAFAQKDGKTPYGPALCLGLWVTIIYNSEVAGLFNRLYQFIW